MIHQNILGVIGNTPIVRLNALSEALQLNVLMKMESLNPGGSHKVRVASNMIADAEQKGVLTRGSGQTIVEPSGGNTGVGLSMCANLYGYKVILVVPDNYSVEKQKLLRLYGAEVILSDSRTGNNSHGEKAFELILENANYVMLNQQRNLANPEVHRRFTAQEIINDFPTGQIDAYVAGIGTGGHITGVSEVLTAKWPNMKTYGVEPEQCDLLNDKHCAHEIQGLSIGLVPDVLNLNCIDGMFKVSKQSCMNMALFALRNESLSLGISSAANLVAIEMLAPELQNGSTVLTMAYDGLESYLSDFE